MPNLSRRDLSGSGLTNLSSTRARRVLAGALASRMADQAPTGSLHCFNRQGFPDFVVAFITIARK